LWEKSESSRAALLTYRGFETGRRIGELEIALRNRRLIPVRVGECRLTGMLSSIIYIDLVNLSEQNADAGRVRRGSVSTLRPTSCRRHRGSGLLMLGLNFSDWLVRFFLRITTQSPLWERQMMAYLAEGPQGVDESMVLFFGGVRSRIHVFSCEPADFVTKLASRWQQEYPDPVKALEKFSPPPPSSMPKKAIFLSYAREDEKAGCSPQERFGTGWLHCLV
jgi:hypothetical protein